MKKPKDSMVVNIRSITSPDPHWKSRFFIVSTDENPDDLISCKGSNEDLNMVTKGSKIKIYGDFKENRVGDQYFDVCVIDVISNPPLVPSKICLS